MIKGGTGGSNTLTGLRYEAKVDLGDFLDSQNGYSVDNTKVFLTGNSWLEFSRSTNFTHF